MGSMYKECLNCGGTTHGVDYMILKENIHKSIKHLYTKNISVDKCIGKEVEFLLKNGVATIGHSCCGHNKEHSQVWILKEYKNMAENLGYTVYEYDKERTDNGVLSCLLKFGNQRLPIKYKGEKFHEK